MLDMWIKEQESKVSESQTIYVEALKSISGELDEFNIQVSRMGHVRKLTHGHPSSRHPSRVKSLRIRDQCSGAAISLWIRYL